MTGPKALAPVALATPASACPSPKPVEGVSPDLVASLVGWIAEHSVYDTTRTRADPPAILSCSVGEAIPYEDATVVVEDDLRAAYGETHRRIYLVEPVALDRPEDQARLLHELIHDVQFQNRDWPCPQAAEGEAFRLTAAWMEEQGLEPDFDWFVVGRLSRCSTGIHP